jgi:hypothetical protein
MTGEEIVAQLVDAMRRADPSYCRSHGVSQTTDEEWDAVMQAAEDWLEDARVAA